MAGTRLGFLNVQGGAYGYSFQIRYWRYSKFHTANVYLPFGWGGTAPSVGTLPRYPVYYYFKGGTWYNPGRDALSVQTGFPTDVALRVSNNFYAVVITIDYRPSGFGIAEGEDIERVYFPDNLEDGARAIQHCRTIADSFPTLGGDRPLTRDPDDSLIFGTSSGAHRALMAQMCPDGTFPYADRVQSDDPYEVRYSHACNPIICSIGQTAISAFSKGGTGYSNFTAFGNLSWGGVLFGAGYGAGSPQRDWNDIPMSLKRQADLGEYAVADNPRAHEVGIYFTAPHISGELPRGNISNTAASDPTSFLVRYWRFNGGQPAAIEQIRPVVDNVAAVSSAGTNLSKFTRTTGSWITDGYLANDIVASDGFGAPTNHHYVVESRTATDLVVHDAAGNVQDVPASPGDGQTIVGGGCYSLHGEEHAYIGHYHMTSLGNTKGRLRAGGTDNTNPDATTAASLADANDVQDWLETEFGWVDLS